VLVNLQLVRGWGSLLFTNLLWLSVRCISWTWDCLVFTWRSGSCWVCGFALVVSVGRQDLVWWLTRDG